MTMIDDRCAICCHETRNATAAVVYFAKQLQLQHPGLAPAMLTAALARLDRQLQRCAPLADPEIIMRNNRS